MMEFTQIADGLKFPERPIAMPDGSVVLREIAYGTLTRVLSNGHTEVIAAPGGGDDLEPAFITLSPLGRLVSAQWPSPGLALNFLNT